MQRRWQLLPDCREQRLRRRAVARQFRHLESALGVDLSFGVKLIPTDAVPTRPAGAELFENACKDFAARTATRRQQRGYKPLRSQSIYQRLIIRRRATMKRDVTRT